MKNIIVGFCCFFIIALVASCGAEGENLESSPSQQETPSVSTEEQAMGLILPIEAISWGMSKEECLSHLSGNTQETVDENGNTVVTVNQEVLGKNATVKLIFYQQTENKYFTNLPEQYLNAMEIQYAVVDYDAVIAELTQKYGMQWREDNVETGKTLYFGSYQLKDISDETIKNQAKMYLAVGGNPGAYDGRTPEQVLEEKTPEEKEAMETSVLDYIMVEVPNEANHFTLKAYGQWMLPIANVVR